MKNWILVLAACAALLFTGSAFGAKTVVEQNLVNNPEKPVTGLELAPKIYRDRAAEINAHVGRIFDTVHAFRGDSRTPFAQGSCVVCHGEGMQIFFNPADETAARLNQPCLGCHTEGARRHFQGSTHEFAGVACVNCHAIHNTRPRLLKADNQIEVCGACHLERKIDFLKPSHHPVPEGLIQCTDCHNPHGTSHPQMLVEHTINQTCYNCHAEKRGPFLHEHNPVRENCTHCHDPHGTVNKMLLKARPPMLCQQCHLSFNAGMLHPNYVRELGANGEFPVQDGRMRGRQCLNCHFQIHGSNNAIDGRSFRR